MRKDFRDKLLGEFKKKVTPDELKKYNDDRLSWAKQNDDKLLKYIDNVANDDPATMQMIRDYNPYEIKYNSTLGQFEQNGKRGSLSDFVKPGDNVDFGLGKPQVFQNVLKNVQNKGKTAKKMNDIDLIFSVADPKEKMEMRKNYKEYDFTQRKFKSDIAKEELLKKPIVKPIPVPRKPIQEPRMDVAEIITQRANDRALVERAQSIREYGDKGLGQLKLKMEGLDE